MLQEFIITFTYEAGIKASIIKQTYLEAYKECKSLSKENDLVFIKETMRILLDIKEGSKTCAEKFMLSGYSNFDKFMEDLIDCDLDEELLSTSFPTSVKPEGPFRKVSIDLEDRDTEENKKNNQEQDI